MTDLGQMGKRMFDVAVSATALVVLSPVLLAVYVLVRLSLGPPVIYRQARPGLRGKCFEMYKFRTMRDLYDDAGRPLADDARLTRVGRWLRSTSLDELPELWNVVKGDMSLVGPRPLLVEYLPLYSPAQMRRHEVLPGLTGWAQVKGRNSLAWEERFDLDVWYVDNRSFWLDVKILFLTARMVFAREGITQEGSATMSKFTGSST